MLKVNGKLFSMHPWLNWIERLATDQEVAGSSPAGCAPFRFTTRRKSIFVKRRDRISKHLYAYLSGTGKDV